jgi:hypothetical protein
LRYAVWVLLVDSKEVHARVQQLANRLVNTVVPVRQEDVHITVWVAGFPHAAPRAEAGLWKPDNITPAALARQAQAAAGTGAQRLLVGRANSSTNCAIFEVADVYGTLQRLRDALTRVGIPEVRFQRYLPHVTVGQFLANTPTRVVRPPLEEMRDLDPVAVTIEELSLVELDAHLEQSLLQVRWRIPLVEGSRWGTPAVAETHLPCHELESEG